MFIRLSRCNLTCGWCDTKYTWDWTKFDPRKEAHRASAAELATWALNRAAELVVITGGEPLLQQQALVPLVSRLVAGGKRVEFETNATIAPAEGLLIEGVRFNCSPKLAHSGVAEEKRIVPGALRAFSECGRSVFKFVVERVEDLDEVAAVVDRFALSPVYIMPEGTTVEGLLTRTRELADEIPKRGWRLTSRTHILAFGDRRGR